MKKILISLFFLISITGIAQNTKPIPEDFPKFIVPGHEKEMETFRKIYNNFYSTTGPAVALWDEWLPMSSLWPAIGTGSKREEMRTKWAKALASRKFSSDGYIITEQHDGAAHAEGWPFPLWTQGDGIGWHFASTGIPGYDGSMTTPEGWKINGGTLGKVNSQGWEVNLTAPNATLQTPGFTLDAKQFPWLRLNWWAQGLEGANCYLEWITEGQTAYQADQRVYFSLTKSDQRIVEHASWAPKPTTKIDSVVPLARTMIPVYKIPTWKGKIVCLRIGFNNPEPVKIVIKSFHAAYESRHNVNNINFIRGCHDYFLWTRDIAFLRSQINRIRTSMRFVQKEFDTQKRKCIYTTWTGHEGRSGVRFVDGKKVIVNGEGIGSNYWDLLPFGGEDALATIYYYDTVLDLAELEELISNHPEWFVASGSDAFNPTELRKHAQEVKDFGTKRFWNEKTGRFGTVDLDGKMHDYGYTFLNNEAIYFDFATPEQAKSIHSWISGERTVKGDTSTGKDIYKWRFGPRTSTIRNIDYYFWAYDPEFNIPWGNSVQDGGAILAWSFYDLMARIKTNGPDDALPLFNEIVKWYDDTQTEGGFRAYYKKDPARGTLQGDNVGGGIGVDAEFMESILVPQVMIYGFLGLKPTENGFTINPQLPKSWPELTITRIHLHSYILDIKVTQDKNIIVTGVGRADDPLVINAPVDYKVIKNVTADKLIIKPDFALSTTKVEVSMTAPSSDAEIRYTVDNTEPSASSMLYKGPLTVEKRAAIKAKVFKNGNPEGYTQTSTIEIYDPKTEGLTFKYYEGKWDKLPDFSKLKPIKAGSTLEINIKRLKMREDYFGIQFSGSLNLKTEGEYTFYINSDDGSKLFIDNKLIIDNDGTHNDQDVKQSKVKLKSGKHAFRLDFYEGNYGDNLKIFIEGPGMEKQEIPYYMLLQK